MKLLNALVAGSLAISVSARATAYTAGDLDVFDLDLSVPGDNPLEHCEDPKNDILIVKSVNIEPNPPKPGENLTVTAKGELLEDVEDGAEISLLVKYGLITIIRQTADLCNTVSNVNLTCPVKKGETEITKVVQLPSIIPPGKYSVLADAYTKDDDRITCLKATIEFKRGGDSSAYKQGL